MKTPKPKTRAAAGRHGGSHEKNLSRSEVVFLKAVAEKIKAARIAKGLTGYELAAMVDIAGPTQFHRESGRVSFPVEMLARYSKALAVPVRDLLPK
jgi:DNA-binding XRE family transcriptional regulator